MLEAGGVGRGQIIQGFGSLLSCVYFILGALGSIGDSKQKSNMINLHFDKLRLPAVGTVNLSIANWLQGAQLGDGWRREIENCDAHLTSPSHNQGF